MPRLGPPRIIFTSNIMDNMHTIPDGTSDDTDTSPWMLNHVHLRTQTGLERIYSPRGSAHSSPAPDATWMYVWGRREQLKVRAYKYTYVPLSRSHYLDFLPSC